MSFIQNYNTRISNDENINSLKNEIKKLTQVITRLNNENNSLKNENQKLKNDIDIQNENLNQYLLKINELNIKLTNKNKEIDNLNNAIKNLQLNNPENDYIKRGEILTIQIKSIDQKVDISYSCKNTDIFVRIEEMLYNQYPEYKDLNTYFTLNGQTIKRFRNMLENNIQNQDKILFNYYE